MYEFLNFYFQVGTFRHGVSNILVVLAILTGVPFGSVSLHLRGSFEGHLILICEEDMFLGIC